MKATSRRIRFNLSIWLALPICLIGCGGGGGGDGGGSSTVEQPASSVSNDGNPSPWQPSGRIIFEQGHDYGYHDSDGVYVYNLESGQLLRYGDGLSPERHANGSKTALLQLCLHHPSEGDFYRAVIGDDSGLFTPVTECSAYVPNPTSDVFLLDDLTEFIGVSLSQDDNYIAVTVNYDVLSDDQSYVAGQVWNTQVFDLSGNLITELENAYDSTWMPDGRLLYVYGNHFYLTDTTLQNPTRIEDGDIFATAVNSPAVHPSGDYFLFVYNQQIWRMNIDGSRPEKLIESDKPVSFPEWSPDGNQFVFTTWRNGTPASVLKSLFFVDVVNDRATRIDLDQVLESLGEPWGRLSWVE